MPEKFELKIEATGNIVELTMFSANYLADRQSFGQSIEGENCYLDAISALGTGGLRYPGGTIAEKFFDISDPRHFEDSNGQPIATSNYFDAAETTTITPLGAFLRFAAQVSQPVTVVIPTIRYFADLSSGHPAKVYRVEQEIKRFITDAIKSQYGSQIFAFEIGNEFPSWIDGHNTSVLSSSADFAMITRNISVWVQEALDAASLPSEPLILAQAAFALYGDRGNSQLLSALFDESLETEYQIVESVQDAFLAIDGVAAHSYPHTPWTQDELGEGNLQRDIEIIERWQQRFDEYATESDLETRNLTGAITEWNIRNSSLNSGLVAGLQGAVGIFSSFHYLVSRGVDLLHAWPILQNTTNALIRTTEAGPELNFNGAALFLLRQNTLGMTAHQGKTHYDLDGDESADIIVQFYSSQEGAFAVIASISEQTLDLAFTLPPGAITLGSYQTYRLTSSSSDPTDVLGAPTVSVAPSQVTSAGGSVLEVTDLTPWSIQIIRFGTGTSENLDGPSSFSPGSDLTFEFFPNLLPVELELSDVVSSDTAFLLATDLDDVVLSISGLLVDGGAGNDTMIGTTGSDRITGGEGDDTVYGGDGDDIIFGSDGNVTEPSDTSSDRIFGGSGSDTITAIGSINGDLVNGEAGDDNIYFDSSAHLILGESGDDTFHLIATEFFSGRYYAYNVSSAEQIGTLEYIPIGGLTALASIIVGGPGYDTLMLSDTADALFLCDVFSPTHAESYFSYSPEARIIGIEVIRSGLGDDLIDLTSHAAEPSLDGLRVLGEEGDDTIWGSSNREWISGGDGDDTIFGGSGEDTLLGGAGADTFVFTATSTESSLVDFDPEEGDELLFVNGGGFQFLLDTLILEDDSASLFYRDPTGASFLLCIDF